MAEDTTKSAPENQTTPQEQAKEDARKAKKVWTLEKCKEAARRFSTREEWQAGAPSSYKSAVHHKWDSECCAAMKPNSGATTKASPKANPKSSKQRDHSKGKISA
jgi:hypothetical protein